MAVLRVRKWCTSTARLQQTHQSLGGNIVTPRHTGLRTNAPKNPATSLPANGYPITNRAAAKNARHRNVHTPCMVQRHQDTVVRCFLLTYAGTTRAWPPMRKAKAPSCLRSSCSDTVSSSLTTHNAFTPLAIRFSKPISSSLAPASREFWQPRSRTPCALPRLGQSHHPAHIALIRAATPSRTSAISVRA
jgi:hypothetical protein